MCPDKIICFNWRPEVWSQCVTHHPWNGPECWVYLTLICHWWLESIGSKNAVATEYECFLILLPSAMVAISRMLFPKIKFVTRSLFCNNQCEPDIVFKSDSSNVITTRFYSGCSWKCITRVSTVSSLVSFKTTSLNWTSLVMRDFRHSWLFSTTDASGVE